jgi:hypothetical protein
MKKPFEPIQYLNIKRNGNIVYIPAKNKLYQYNISDFLKTQEITYEDEILDFHPISNNNILIVGKSNKKICKLNSKGEITDTQ